MRRCSFLFFALIFATNAAAQAQWLPLPTATAPAATLGHRVAYDPASQRTFALFGQPLTGAVSSSMWDGANWAPCTTQVTGGGFLLVSRDHALATETSSGGLLMFGGWRPGFGIGGGTPIVLDGTWRIATSATGVLQFTQLAPATRPAARQGAAMVRTHQGVLLFGGGAVSGLAQFGDTWLWNGTTWTPIATPTVPPARLGHLAFDTSRQVLALYLDGLNSAASELWELGPGGWSFVNDTAPGFGRFAYDPQAGNLAVLHSTGRADLVAGAWVLSASQRMNGTWLLTETNRGVLLAGGPLVWESTLNPAAAASYGSGCGPLGEVTCAFDRAATYGVVVTAEVRALEANAPTFLFYGATGRDLPFGGGCASYLDDVLLAIGAVAAGSTWATFPLAIPATPSLAGVELFAQPVTLHNGGIGIGNGASLRIGL